MINNAQSDGTDRTRIRDGELLDIESGAEIQVKSGGAIDIESGGALKLAGTAIAASAAEINAACDVSARAPVVITDAAAYSILAANSGKLHVISDMTQDSTFNLPVEAAGLEYEFMYAGAAADAHDHNIDSGSDTNFLIGGVGFLDSDAGPGAKEISTVFSDNNSNSIFNILNMAAGSRLKIVCDGTNWYINGMIVSDTAPTFADQA